MDNNHLIFDFQSSTPCSTKVVEEMAPYWNELWGNPSNNNRAGVYASAAVEVSREKIASYLSLLKKEKSKVDILFLEKTLIKFGNSIIKILI